MRGYSSHPKVALHSGVGEQKICVRFSLERVKVPNRRDLSPQYGASGNLPGVGGSIWGSAAPISGSSATHVLAPSQHAHKQAASLTAAPGRDNLPAMNFSAGLMMRMMRTRESGRRCFRSG
jgi:hypothetical protein